ncbi:MAG TPA: hypothetical protein PK668_18105 [Myxococcota bacterium]|nr:hypothetical protein [Myxococcota bacterium]HRY95877.1 hypothetical protein [Myxococcota bacterium]HSA22110.1 hypothetical protein [Myxococcota bacterium]
MNRLHRPALAGLGLLLSVLALGCLRPAGAEEPVRVVMPGLQAHAGVPDGAAQVLGDLVLEGLLNRHGLRALGPSDMRTLLQAEEQKRLLGCYDEACMVSLVGALGADWLVGGSVGRLEDQYVLSLVLIEAKEARVTARVSAQLDSLKAAPAQVGPLVDRLLGQRPRVRVPSALVAPPPAVERAPLELTDFRRRAEGYVASLKRGPYAPALVEERRALLEDLAITPLAPMFLRKLNTFWAIPGAVDADTRLQVRTATEEGSARDARLRLLEWFALVDQLELLKAAHARGLEMEKSGAGTRLQALPFEVKPALPEELPDSPERRAYLEARAGAVQAVERALQGLEAGNPLAFAQEWFQPGDMSSSGPKATFEELRKHRQNGFSLRLCPLFTVSTDDLRQAVERFRAKGEVELCVLRTRGEFASQQTLELAQKSTQWRIRAW